VEVAIFPEFVVVVEWSGLPEIEDRTVAKAAKMIVFVAIAESGLSLVEDP
jgi:hypothetical protein